MDINQIIDKALEKDLRQREIGVYYISEIPYCLRKIWFMFKYPKKHDAKTLRVFERGNVFHAWIANILKKSDMITYHEEEARLIIPDFKSKLFLRGRVDDFIVLQEGDKKYVLEIKTTANIDYQDSISPMHLFQITPYLLLEHCDGKVVYIDSRYLRIKEFDVQFNWDTLEEIMRRARTVHESLINDTIPFPESWDNETRKWECGYCIYNEECGKNREADNGIKA